MAIPEMTILAIKQRNQAYDTGCINCAGCGMIRSIVIAYQCLYCLYWFCQSCGESHFGQTRYQYYAAKAAQNKE